MKLCVYEKCKEFLRKYPFTVCFRVKRHSKVIQKHLNEGEEVSYVFAGQKSSTSLSIFSSCVVVFTNKRMLVAKKRIVPGYFYTSITPDMLNDFEIKRGIFFGKVFIDTI
ncbi:MAG TPA: PH domain-containing protein, partial [Bacilli bacterium]|nr:PH domain-containing protein [Bacilli bacterium]